VDRSVFNLLERFSEGVKTLQSNLITQGGGSKNIEFTDSFGLPFVAGSYIESGIINNDLEYPRNDAEALANPTIALCFKGEALYKDQENYYTKVKQLLDKLKGQKSRGLISSFVLDEQTEEIIKNAGFSAVFVPITGIGDVKKQAALGNIVLFESKNLPKSFNVKVLLDQTGQGADTNENFDMVRPSIYNSLLLEWEGESQVDGDTETKYTYALGVYYTAFLSTLKERLETRKDLLLALCKYDEFLVAGRVNAKNRNTSTKPFEAKVALNFLRLFNEEKKALESMSAKAGFRYILPDIPTMQYLIKKFGLEFDLGTLIPLVLDDVLSSKRIFNYTNGDTEKTFQDAGIDGLVNSETVLNPKFMSNQEPASKPNIENLVTSLQAILKKAVTASEMKLDLVIDVGLLAVLASLVLAFLSVTNINLANNSNIDLSNTQRTQQTKLK